VKKKKDKKYLSKKARLREWRKETFGDAEGPQGGFELLVGDEEGAPTARDEESNIVEGEKKKKKRSRKRKAGAVEA
jgi:protein KRI1